MARYDTTSARRGQITSSTRSTRRSSLVVLAFLVLALVGTPSWAAACPVTDPTCVTEEVQKTVDRTAGEAQDTLDDTSEQAADHVNDAVETVEQMGDETQQTVHETITPGSQPDFEPPKPPTDPSDPTPEEQGPQTGKHRPDVRGGRIEDNNGKNNGSKTQGRRAALGPAPLDRPLTIPSDTLLPAATETQTREETGGFAESALDAAKTFAFPLVMTLLVGIYLAIQHRVDRRDPKFVLAPFEHEFLSFE